MHDLTDAGNARRFIESHGTKVRYCREWMVWLTWDGERWSVDPHGARRLARRTAIAIDAEAAATPLGEGDRRRAIRAWARYSESFTGVKRMLEEASALVPLTEAEYGYPIRVLSRREHEAMMRRVNSETET